MLVCGGSAFAAIITTSKQQQSQPNIFAVAAVVVELRHSLYVLAFLAAA